MDIPEQLRLLKSSKHLHGKWYRETYPEVAALNIDPALHYLNYGAAMGRNPGKNFDTRFYLRSYPEAAQSGLNPVLHYELHGRHKGYATRPPRSPGAKHVETVRTKLLSLGFTEHPLQELAHVRDNAQVAETRALAARELALWHLRQKTPEGYRTALSQLGVARADAPNLAFRRKLAVAELLCHHFLGNEAEGLASYERAALAGETSPDLLLARANLEPGPEARVALMNRVLRGYGISPIALLPDESLPPYDRLTSAEPLEALMDGPKVTVLIAAYDAADTLPTALRSLQEQTWKNLEILVLDDCSPTSDTVEVAQRFAADDPRIRVIRMERNGGAYVARNRGLDEATGEYVTLHDADDWSHPKKIEAQARFMQENPDVMGCTIQQARASTHLDFQRLTQGGNLITSNTSSFFWRRAEIVEALGCWDTVRFGADSDLVRRTESLWGKQAVVRIPSGPLSFQRNHGASAVNEAATAAESLPFGIRKEYYEIRQSMIARGATKETGLINTAAPLRMRTERVGYDAKRHFDVVIASDFRMQGGSTQSSIQEIRANKKFGIRTGLLPMYRYDFPPERPMETVVRQEIDEDLLQLLTYGDRISCNLLIIRYPPVLYHFQRFLPKIDAKEIKVIINQPPMSDYGSAGVIRYDLAQCANNIRYHFGKDAMWYPIGPLVRDVLHERHAAELRHIDLSDEDWSNIIDISGWDRGPRKRGPEDRLRIGRHSRDHEHKWPNTRGDIQAAYPDADDIEVHVLGGASAPKALIGYIPDNWVVHPFGSVAPRDFLKDIDVWIYFSHPDWLESFGRTIIEAMATGVPVILPEVYRPLFQDAAIYATPGTAIEIARKLHADPVAYEAQVARAHSYVQSKFSFEMHIKRIEASAKMPLVAPVKDSEHEAFEVSLGKPSGATVPAIAGKISVADLQGMPVLSLSAGNRPLPDKAALLKETVAGYKYDYLWAPKKGARRLFVLFSGDAQRKKNNPPVFQRWSWASNFPGHCLYVSDPMLHLAPDLGLAWYAGTHDHDPMDTIIGRIQDMLPILGLTAADVCAYGSSGGGFAALRMAALLPDAAAVSVNPQTNIARYEMRSPDRYARICLNRADRHEALADFPKRMDLAQHVAKLRQQRLVLIQNTLDNHHYEDHYKPFCAAMGEDPAENLDSGLFRRILFAHEGGHAKAETPEVFNAAISIVENGFVSPRGLQRLA